MKDILDFIWDIEWYWFVIGFIVYMRVLYLGQKAQIMQMTDAEKKEFEDKERRKRLGLDF